MSPTWMTEPGPGRVRRRLGEDVCGRGGRSSPRRAEEREAWVVRGARAREALAVVWADRWSRWDLGERGDG